MMPDIFLFVCIAAFIFIVGIAILELDNRMMERHRRERERK